MPEAANHPHGLSRCRQVMLRCFEFDAAVIEESGQGRLERERITNGLGERASGWNAAKLDLEPRLDSGPSMQVRHRFRF